MNHLLCHLWPQTNGKWRATADGLRKRWHLFDGRKVVALVMGDGCDSVETVKAAFPSETEFLIRTNRPNLREVATFEKLLECVEHDRDGRFFYCHGKGSTHGHDDSVCHLWREAMLEVLLDNPKLIDCALSRHPVAGCFRMFHRFGMGGHNWHYSGSFFWARNRDVFARNWRSVDRIWFGSEAWPGKHFTREESACLFLDNCGELYDSRYWETTVTPALQVWKERIRSCTPSETTPSPSIWSRLQRILFRRRSVGLGIVR